MSHLNNCKLAVAALLAIPASAMAGVVAAPVPEPDIISLIAGGAIVLLIANRIKRK